MSIKKLQLFVSTPPQNIFNKNFQTPKNRQLRSKVECLMIPKIPEQKKSDGNPPRNPIWNFSHRIYSVSMSIVKIQCVFTMINNLWYKILMFRSVCRVQTSFKWQNILDDILYWFIFWFLSHTRVLTTFFRAENGLFCYFWPILLFLAIFSPKYSGLNPCMA